MAELFNRAVQVTFGPKDSAGRQVRGLRVVFSVEKSLEKQPNPAKIQIYNMSEESRAIAEDKKSAVILEAGYGRWITDTVSRSEKFQGDLRKLFIGDVAKVKTEKQGADIITTIEAGDGENAYNYANMDASFAAGTRVSQVLDGIVSSFGLTKGNLLGLNLQDQFQQGLTLSGLTRDHLSLLTNRQGLEWSIQDDQLQILPPATSTTQEAVLLNKATGLIGSPFKTKIVNQDLITKKDGKEAAAGTQATSLLNAEIRPGRLIKLESDFVNGVFKVTKVTHAGDTHSQQFYSQLEAK